jgi:hypothetical protein
MQYLVGVFSGLDYAHATVGARLASEWKNIAPIPHSLFLGMASPYGLGFDKFSAILACHATVKNRIRLRFGFSSSATQRCTGFVETPVRFREIGIQSLCRGMF